jgi:hypothetical protein
MSRWQRNRRLTHPGYVNVGGSYGPPTLLVASTAPQMQEWPYAHQDPLRNRCAITRTLALLSAELEDTQGQVENAELDHQTADGTTLDSLGTDVDELTRRVDALESELES